MTKNLFLIIATILISVTTSIAQEWHWEWATSYHNENPYTGVLVDNVDFFNNIYSVIQYDSILILPDTTYYHPEQHLAYSNAGIIKNDEDGNYLNSIDIYTLPYNFIYNPHIATDKENNMFVACSFSDRLFVQDTTIYHCTTPYPTLSDVVLMKFDRNMKIKWAGLIGGTFSDNFYKILSDRDDNLYILSEHVASNENPTTVVFFDQDTTFSTEDFCSVTKVDNNGNLLWHNDFEVLSYSSRLIEGADGNLYFFGSTDGDIVYNGDTIYNPDNPDIFYEFFYAIIEPDGNVSELTFPELTFPMNVHNMDVNEAGEMYLTGSVFNTLVIGKDTTIVPKDDYWGFIGKYNQQQELLWHYIIPRNEGQYLGIMYVKEDYDNVIFTLSSDNDVVIGDSIVDIYSGMETVIGEFDGEGNLQYIKSTNTSNTLKSFSFILDNCKNPVISGYFKGKSIFGNDTINSFYYTVQDGFMAKFIRNEPEEVYIGPDTTACGEYTIYGPDGYQYYRVNDLVSEENGITVYETGTYYFACADEYGCWLYDTINITIHPSFTVNLGNDTTISKNDTIVFQAPYGYESYLWSDGSTSNMITVIGNEYGLGNFDIWVQVTDGPCVITDTVSLTISVGIDEFYTKRINAYPNPVTAGSITFEYENTVHNSNMELKCYDILGTQVHKEKIYRYQGKSIVDVSGWLKGIYLAVVFSNGRAVGKCKFAVQ